MKHTLAQLNEKSNAEIDRIAAEVRGWVDIGCAAGEWWDRWERADGAFMYHKHWHPTTCRNQSHEVVMAATENGQRRGRWHTYLVESMREYDGQIIEMSSIPLAEPRNFVIAAILTLQEGQ